VQRMEAGATAAEVARAFEINPTVLHRWWREPVTVARESRCRSGRSLSCASFRRHKKTIEQRRGTEFREFFAE